MHVHEHEDEYSYVLEGRVGVQIGDETARWPDPARWSPSRAVSGTRSGTPGDEPARLLELISPAGFEQYFADMAPVLNVDGPPDFERLAAIQSRYGLQMDRDSIGTLSERHGLDMPG